MFFIIAIMCFTKIKIKLKDILFVVGLLIFSLMAERNIFFLYLIGFISLTNIITSFLNSYIKEENQIFTRLENSKIFLIVLCSFSLIISINQLSIRMIRDYVHTSTYPVNATKWIKDNLDYKNMRIWNHFNWGSYLELNGIKVFLDSRSGMYTQQENNGCTVLNDWLLVTKGIKHYQEVFDEYDIDYVLVRDDELLYVYISKDNNYKEIYQDGLFSIYEKK